MKHCGLFFAAGLWLASGLALAGQEAKPLQIGTLRRMYSEILKEDRTLSIRVPASYEQARLSYPVIFLLYADQTEGYFAETVFALERLEGGAEIPELGYLLGWTNYNILWCGFGPRADTVMPR